MRCFTAHAVVFDMDGVLVDSTPAIEFAWRATAQRYGRALSDGDLARYVRGRQGRYAVAALFPEHSPAQQEEIWRYACEMEEGSDSPPVPGAVALVRALHDAGVALGLATSNGPAGVARVLTTLGLTGLFQCVVDQTAPGRGKPYPDPYLGVAQGLGVAAERMLVFEDSASGLAAAASAGASCIAIGGSGPAGPSVLATVADFVPLRVERGGAAEVLLTGLPAQVSLRTTRGGAAG
jgi:sugar-phosphatase